jgi:hypothetical protein
MRRAQEASTGCRKAATCTWSRAWQMSLAHDAVSVGRNLLPGNPSLSFGGPVGPIPRLIGLGI